MAKFKIKVECIEIYSDTFIVEAKNLDEAVKKMEKAFGEDGSIYESVTQCMDNQEVNYYKCGKADDDSNVDVK